MATQPHNIIPFTGEQVGPVFERRPTEQRAVRDARLIRQSDHSTAAALWLAWLQTEQPERLAAMAATLEVAPQNKDTEEAAALVRYANGSREHKQLVSSILNRMAGAGL